MADLVAALAAGPARAALVADDDGTAVGHVMLSRGWIDAERELVEVLVLSPLSVDPPRQGRGIGGSLVRAALTEAELLGAPAVFLEGSPAYYARFGFVAGESRGFTRPSVSEQNATLHPASSLGRRDRSMLATLPDAKWRNPSVPTTMPHAKCANGDLAGRPFWVSA